MEHSTNQVASCMARQMCEISVVSGQEHDYAADCFSVLMLSFHLQIPVFVSAAELPPLSWPESTVSETHVPDLCLLVSGPERQLGHGSVCHQHPVGGPGHGKTYR